MGSCSNTQAKKVYESLTAFRTNYYGALNRYFLENEKQCARYAPFFVTGYQVEKRDFSQPAYWEKVPNRFFCVVRRADDSRVYEPTDYFFAQYKRSLLNFFDPAWVPSTRLLMGVFLIARLDELIKIAYSLAYAQYGKDIAQAEAVKANYSRWVNADDGLSKILEGLSNVYNMIQLHSPAKQPVRSASWREAKNILNNEYPSNALQHFGQSDSEGVLGFSEHQAKTFSLPVQEQLNRAHTQHFIQDLLVAYQNILLEIDNIKLDYAIEASWSKLIASFPSEALQRDYKQWVEGTHEVTNGRVDQSTAESRLAMQSIDCLSENEYQLLKCLALALLFEKVNDDQQQAFWVMPTVQVVLEKTGFTDGPQQKAYLAALAQTWHDLKQRPIKPFAEDSQFNPEHQAQKALQALDQLPQFFACDEFAKMKQQHDERKQERARSGSSKPPSQKITLKSEPRKRPIRQNQLASFSAFVRLQKKRDALGKVSDTTGAQKGGALQQIIEHLLNLATSSGGNLTLALAFLRLLKNRDTDFKAYSRIGCFDKKLEKAIFDSSSEGCGVMNRRQDSWFGGFFYRKGSVGGDVLRELDRLHDQVQRENRHLLNDSPSSGG